MLLRFPRRTLLALVACFPVFALSILLPIGFGAGIADLLVGAFEPAANASFGNEPGFLDRYSAVVGIGVIVLLVLAFMHAINADRAWRRDAVFYPVSLSKFLVMTIGSYGFYPFFWAYKNWQWLKEKEGEQFSPALRALFYIFTNFDLFARIAMQDRQEGRLLERFAGLLAGLYLVVAVFGRIAGRVDGLFLFVLPCFLISTGLMIPFVREIGRLNAANPTLAKRNSRYTWHSLLALSPALLFFTFLLMGLFGF